MRDRRLLHEEAQTVHEWLEIAPGIEMSRRGRFIETVNHQTREEFEQFTAALAEEAAEIPARLRAKIQELRDIIDNLPMREVVANLIFLRHTGDPETFKEYEAKPFLGVEYLLWLYLTNAAPPPIDGEPVDGAVIERIEILLDDVINDTYRRITTDHLRRGRKVPEPIDHLLVRTKLEHLLVRGPAYQQHLAGQLAGLFQPFSETLCNSVGFDIEEALSLTGALHLIVNDRLHALQDELVNTTNRWTTALTNEVARDQLAQGELKVVERIRSIYADDPEDGARSVVGRWFLDALQDAFTVNPGALASAARATEASATAFLERLSLGFGQPPIADSTPSVYEPQVLAPLVNLGDGRWFAPLLPHIWWALKPSLEAALARNKDEWSRYDRHRAKYLAERAVALVADVSPHSRSWTSLKYDFDAGEGSRGYELDGLVIIDDTAFLIEAKAGVMDDAARRGARESMLEDLEKLVGSAYQQARRAERYLESAPELGFRAADGREVRLRRGDLRRVFLVSVTLDQLSAFVTQGRELRRLELLPADSQVWSVYLADLEVISELIEGAGQLVHYLLRRHELEDLRVMAHDELDWFGHYLLEGLYFADVRAGKVDAQNLLSYTTVFDEYFAFTAGARRTPVPKPRQTIPDEIRELIDRLEHEAPPGFVEAVTSLLEGSSETQEFIAGGLTRQRRRATKIGTAGFRIFLGDRGLAFLATDGRNSQVFDGYVLSMRSERPIAIGVGIMENIASGADGLAVAVQTFAGPLSESERATADAAVKMMRSRVQRHSTSSGTGPPMGSSGDARRRR